MLHEGWDKLELQGCPFAQRQQLGLGEKQNDLIGYDSQQVGMWEGSSESGAGIIAPYNSCLVGLPE